eukprot:1552932-Prorocentrum_lima.AAC.1
MVVMIVQLLLHLESSSTTSESVSLSGGGGGMASMARVLALVVEPIWGLCCSGAHCGGSACMSKGH